MEFLEKIIMFLINISIPVFELIGVIVVAVTVVSSFISYIRSLTRKKAAMWSIILRRDWLCRWSF